MVYEIRIKNMEHGKVIDEIILHFDSGEEQDMLHTAKMIALHSGSLVTIDIHVVEKIMPD